MHRSGDVFGFGPVRFTFLYHQFLHVLLCGGRIRHSICSRISQDLRLQGLRSLAHCVYQHLWLRILDMCGEINQDGDPSHLKPRTWGDWKELWPSGAMLAARSTSSFAPTWCALRLGKVLRFFMNLVGPRAAAKIVKITLQKCQPCASFEMMFDQWILWRQWVHHCTGFLTPSVIVILQLDLKLFGLMGFWGDD